jgi:hypothetical protein
MGGFETRPYVLLPLDIGVQGYTGKREGVTGNFRANYRFRGAGVRDQGSGIRSQESGVRSQESARIGRGLCTPLAFFKTKAVKIPVIPAQA